MFIVALFVIAKWRQLKRNQMSVNSKIDKYTMVYSYNEILYSNENE